MRIPALFFTRGFFVLTKAFLKHGLARLSACIKQQAGERDHFQAPFCLGNTYPDIRGFQLKIEQEGAVSRIEFCLSKPDDLDKIVGYLGLFFFW